MKNMLNIYDIAEHRLQWAKRLREENEKLEAEVQRLRKIEQEWLMMWATLEELNLVADVRKNMTEHGWEGDEE